MLVLIDPTATLDVNGVLRLRTHSPPSQSNVSAEVLFWMGLILKAGMEMSGRFYQHLPLLVQAMNGLTIIFIWLLTQMVILELKYPIHKQPLMLVEIFVYVIFHQINR